MKLETTQDHNNFKNDIADLLRKYEHMGPVELLAVASQVVGQVAALQDQRSVTSEMVMDVVIKNIQIGNSGVVNELLHAPTGGPQ